MNTSSTSGLKGFWLSGVAGLSLTLGAGTALAGTDTADGVPAISVSYAGLDLSTHAGAQLLYRRIEGAANQVCSALQDLRHAVAWRRCYVAAVDHAVADVHRPALTALHRRYTGANAGS